MNRIKECFDRTQRSDGAPTQPAFIPFITGGAPDIETTEKLLYALLNEDFLTSFSAQTSIGIESSREETKSRREEKSNPKFSFKPSIDVGAKKIIKAKAKMEASFENASLTRSDESISKIIYEKKRHDDLFSDFDKCKKEEY